MSWYLANEDGIIDQFASGGGLHDLRIAIEAGNYPALQDFIDVGATKNMLLCICSSAYLAEKNSATNLSRTLRENHRSDAARAKDGLDYPGHDGPRWKEQSSQEIATAPEAC